MYTEAFGDLAYIIKARMQLMRDLGCYPSAHSAFLLNLGIETLPVRMKQYCENALIVAKHFEKSSKILSVRYPGLENDPYYKLACSGACGPSGGRSRRDFLFLLANWEAELVTALRQIEYY